MMKAIEVFATSDGAVTRNYYSTLSAIGPVGIIAMNLIRAQKCSSRAKKYRGGIRGVGSYRSMAYDRKGWSLKLLASALVAHGSNLGITFGWAVDDNQTFNRHVFYVDLPQGQVSFHSPERYEGPDYQGQWDGERKSEVRILAFSDSVRQLAPMPPLVA
jgi:hypothetical protein